MLFKALLVLKILLGVTIIIIPSQKSQENKFNTLHHSDFEKKTCTQECNKMVYIYIQFVDAKIQTKLQKDFIMLTSSMMSKTNCPIQMFITTDEFGVAWTKKLFRYYTEQYVWFVMPTLKYYNINDVLSNLSSKIYIPLKELFSSGPESLYSRSLFHITPAIHRIIPRHVNELILLDLDMKFNSDIKVLSSLFNEMTNSNIMGLALEQTPVYYHVTTDYRDENPDTIIGKPGGIAGFNGGVKLFKLEAMRRNARYNMYLDRPMHLKMLADNYKFRGHLGDQDFYTLLSFEHSDWFLEIPCGWNRQLCQWWRYNGYRDIFELYNNCPKPHHIVHGNCGTEIPVEGHL